MEESNMLICKHCGKECKNENSLRNHERLCKENPNRQFTPFHNQDFQRSNNENQYTKAKRLGLELPVVSEETRAKLRKSNASRTPEWNKENGKRISETIKKKVREGTWHTSLARHMHIDYNGVDLHGSWELKYAQYLDANNIKWIRNKDSFHYEFEGKSRKYTPDFYLLESDEYIEIKGYKTEKDEAKWSQFPTHRKLVILMKKELEDLSVI
ncbi:MAG: hypothetical protein EBS98_10405 [Chitinophagia bacterium]|jgi:PAB1-binding protein PBP1|nr:hypothetical protein [Chitinophagia bacterium]